MFILIRNIIFDTIVIAIFGIIFMITFTVIFGAMFILIHNIIFILLYYTIAIAMFGIIFIVTTTDGVMDIAVGDTRIGTICATMCQPIFLTIYATLFITLCHIVFILEIAMYDAIFIVKCDTISLDDVKEIFGVLRPLRVFKRMDYWWFVYNLHQAEMINLMNVYYQLFFCVCVFIFMCH